MRKWTAAAIVLWALATVAAAQQVRRQQFGGPRPPDRERTVTLSIEEQRKLGLSDAQIQKIAEARAGLERERAKLEEQLEGAYEAVANANAAAGKLRSQVRDITSVRIRKVYESVMTPEQLAAWKKQGYVEQAKRYLRQYSRWLNLKDEQVEDIALLLVPVYRKYDKLDEDERAAREALAELRRAEKVDVAAIEAAEKKVAELDELNSYNGRTRELRDAMRAGLMPDQLERLEQGGQRRRG